MPQACIALHNVRHCSKPYIDLTHISYIYMPGNYSKNEENKFKEMS